MIDLESIEKRENAASPGPWQAQIPAMSGEWPKARIKGVKWAGRLYGSLMTTASDAEFIAHAREDIPNLIAEVKRLRKLLEDE